jgi:hypothetical protein
MANELKTEKKSAAVSMLAEGSRAKDERTRFVAVLELPLVVSAKRLCASRLLRT